ncbi:substrate-binding domain-containing protein [Spirosoma aerophilum]
MAMSTFSKFCLLVFLLFISCTQKEKPKYTIGFSQCLMSDNWRKDMYQGMKRELSFYPDISMEMKVANGDSKKQNEQIQEFVTQKVDLLIVSPNEKDANTSSINQAYLSGIPVIILDRRISSTKYTAFVGAENYLVGQNAGIYANTLLKGHGTVLEISAAPNTSPSIDRHLGFVQALKQYPAITYAGIIWQNDQLDQILPAYLKAHPQIDVIYAHYDRLALIVSTICQSLSLRKKFKIIGVDGLAGKNEGLDLVKKGLIDATILYPTGGEEAIKNAVSILTKKPFKRENKLFTTVINPDNVEIMLAQYQKIREQQQSIERQTYKLLDLSRIYSSQKKAVGVLLALLTLVVIFGAVLLSLLREKQQSNKVLAQQKEEIERISAQARQATEDKMRFYSYISHEFKTPLSLILTPADDLLNRKTYDGKEGKRVLELIRKNANRLLKLVDQVLDLRRIDAGKIELLTATHDLVKFIQEIVNDFSFTARKNQIDLQFIHQLPELPYTFDAEKLDKVLFNLLSNAFKYTAPGGLIHVSLTRSADRIKLIITDNGVGMDAIDKAHAFDLYYRGNQSASLGSGLGLALSQEFVVLHQGEITLTSEPGKGTTFTITLPYSPPQDPIQLTSAPVFDHSVETEKDTRVVDAASSADQSMVIIEDNSELLTFLQSRFAGSYRILPAETAEKGWELILQNIPDIILSDVTLPGQSGIWLTQRVKEDFRTSHIPVILITAKGGLENQLEGTEAGADAYIPKPFNQQLLEVKVRNLLGNRDRMRRRFSNEITNPQQVQSKERKFLLDFELLLEKHINSNQLSVENLSRELGMSRVQLYRKITALTNKNVNDYIADYRIKKAKQLLGDQTKNISEIAYALGFKDPAYFATFFRQKVGQTPSEWRNS